MKKTPEQYIVDIQEACKELGWQIAMKDVERVSGLVIGNSEYIDETLSSMPDGDQYEVWETPIDEGSELH